MPLPVVDRAREARVKASVRQHPRAAGVGITASAVAILGIAVVVGWAMFSGLQSTADVEATPTASSGASGEASASTPGSSGPAALAVPTAIPGLGWPPVGEAGYYVSGSLWAVSAVNDLNIRSGPGTEYTAKGQLDAGDLALVTDGAMGPQWVGITADGVTGWVNLGPEEDPWLLRTPTPWKAYASRLAGVASNGSTYLAFGMGSEPDYVPYEGGEGPLLLLSDDGLTWTRLTDGPPGMVTAVAGGPGGWVALSQGSMMPSFATFSADGRTWKDPQVMGAGAVAYGPGGWVVVGGSSAWRSADGRSWEESGAFGEPVYLDQVESSNAGYIIYGRGASEIRGSPDGLRWTATNLPVDAGFLTDVELVGDRVLVLLTESDGNTRLLHGRLGASGEVTWDETLPDSVDGDGYRIDSISQGPQGLLARGWDSADLVPMLWRSTAGTTWQRLDVGADALGGSVGPEAAWGAAGWVAVGSAKAGAGQAPRGGFGSYGALDGAAQQLWRSTDGQTWLQAGDPIAYSGSEPPCPPAGGVSTLVLMYLGPFAEHCFGDASLTIRGWVPVIEGLGGCCWPTPEPGWLAGPYAGGYIAAGDYAGVFPSLGLYIPPGVNQSALRQESWVEVVGHFRDAAAGSCRRIPLVAPPMRLESLRAVERDCEQRFVVESIRAVDGP